MTDRLIKLSATSIMAFRSCPMKYRLRYVEGLRPNRDADVLRIGTNWHNLQETYSLALAETGDRDAAFTQAVEHLNDSYAAVPDWISDDDWAAERQVLATSFAAYLWYYADGDESELEVLAVEQMFDLPLHDPATGMPLPLSKVTRVGKMDRVVRHEGRVCIQEYKSTSKDVSDGSTFWNRLRLDVQVGMYDLAMRDTPQETLSEWGVREGEEIGATLYDVWHKPTTTRKALTQKDTTAMLESGEYFGQEYEIRIEVRREGGWEEITLADVHGKDEEQLEHRAVIDGEIAEATAGAKVGTLAIKETPTMFGSRLMADIVSRPEHYFRRRQVVRTTDESHRFRRELFNTYLAMRHFERTGAWYQDGTQCRATYSCDMLGICEGPTPVDDVCDGEFTPTGYSRRATLTVNQEAV